jgi:hypothetical protein
MHLQPLPSVMGCIEYVKLVSVRRRAMIAREIEALPTSLTNLEASGTGIVSRRSATWHQRCNSFEANETADFPGVRATTDPERS